MICDGCPYYINRGPNLVPWGNTMVNEGDVWECDKELDPDDCDSDRHLTVRSHGLSEEDWERADWQRDRRL